MSWRVCVAVVKGLVAVGALGLLVWYFAVHVREAGGGMAQAGHPTGADHVVAAPALPARF